MALVRNYLDKLKERSRESRVYRKYQLVGLEIAGVLKDQKHKSLYIKMAKEGNPNRLLRLAKEVAGKRNVRNKGAYFMKLCQVVKIRPARKDSDIGQ